MSLSSLNQTTDLDSVDRTAVAAITNIIKKTAAAFNASKQHQET